MKQNQLQFQLIFKNKLSRGLAHRKSRRQQKKWLLKPAQKGSEGSNCCCEGHLEIDLAHPMEVIASRKLQKKKLMISELMAWVLTVLYDS